MNSTPENELQNQIKKLWENTLTGDEIPGQTIKDNQKSSLTIDRSSIPVFQISHPTPFDETTGFEVKTLIESNLKTTNESSDIKASIETMEECPTTQEPHTQIGTVVDEGTQESHTTNSNSFVEDVQKNNDFTLLSELGRGGMGVVYLAIQNSLKREVAIKSIPGRNSDENSQSRFVSEAMVTAELDHPNIVPVHSLVCGEDGSIYMAMKKVDGFSWQNLLYPKTPEEQKIASTLSQQDHLEILIKVCDAVCFAHSHNVIHRDLKPDNIMVGHFGEVLLMDWGIALDVSSSPSDPQKLEHKSQISHPAGTPSYMAPEMASGENNKIGFATDIYLLGAILYEILTGTAPHGGNSILEILCRASQGKLESPRKRSQNKEIPEELEEITIKAMAKDPKDRYPSAREFQKALREYLSHHESLIISHKARAIIEDIKAKGRQGKLVIDEGYLECDNAFNSFQRALEVWSENQKAYQGAIEAVKIQAEWAHSHGDTRVSLLQIQRLKAMSPPALDIAKEIEKKLNYKRYSLLRTAIGIIALLTIFWFVKKSVETSQEEKQRYEIQAKNQAIQQKLIAAKEDYDPQKILAILKKIPDPIQKNKMLENEIINALQCRDYQTAKDFILQNIDPEATLSEKISKNLAQHLPKNLQLDFSTLQSVDKALSRLFDYSALGIPGNDLIKMWEGFPYQTTFPEALVKATILCISSEFHWNNKRFPEAQKQIQLVQRLPLGQKIFSETPFSVKLEKRGDVLWAMHNDVKKSWCFPPYPSYIHTSNFIVYPEKQEIFIGYGNFLLVLDGSTGKIKRRYRVGDQVVYLQHTENSIEVEYGNKNTGTMHFMLGQQKFVERAVAGTSVMQQLQTFIEMSKALAYHKIEKEDSSFTVLEWKNPENALLKIQELKQQDPTNQAYTVAEAICLNKLNRQEEAEKIWQKLQNTKLSLYEWILVGNVCFDQGLKNRAKQAFSKARAIQAQTFHNPQIATGLISSPVIFIRKTCEKLIKEEKWDDFLELFEEGRNFAVFVEGDYYVYKNLANIYQDKSPEKAKEFAQKVKIADKNGGGISLASNIVMVYTDVLIPFCVFISAVLGLLIIWTWYKYRHSRIEDLATLGRRNVWYRNLAFVLHPIRRIRYTFIAYMARTERFALAFIAITFIAANAMLFAIIQHIAVMAAAPLSISSGYIGGLEASSYIKQQTPTMSPTLKNLLLAEGAYQKNLLESAKDLWKSSLPHPIAKNNYACMVAQSQPQESIKYWQQLQRLQQPLYRQIASINLKIINSQEISKVELGSLPKNYQNNYQHFPQKPIMLQCDYSIFSQIFNSHFVSLREFLKTMFLAEDISSMSSIFEVEDFGVWGTMVQARTFLTLLAFLLFVSILFPVRPSSMKHPKLVELLLKLCKKLGHIFPGATFALNHNHFLGALLLVVTCFNYSCIHVWLYQGMVSQIAVPSFPLAYVDSLWHPLQILAGRITFVLLIVTVVFSVFYHRQQNLAK